MEPKVFYPLLKKFIPAVIAALILLWLYKFYGALAYTLKNMPEFIRLTWEHLLLVVISLSVAATVGVSLGTIMTRKGFENFGPAIMTLVNIWQSVPSLGVIALAYGILPVFGLSGIGAVPALILSLIHI